MSRFLAALSTAAIWTLLFTGCTELFPNPPASGANVSGADNNQVANLGNEPSTDPEPPEEPPAATPPTPRKVSGATQPGSANPKVAAKPVNPGPEKADLALLDLTIKDSTLTARIFNGGPLDHDPKSDGARQFTVTFPGAEGIFSGEIAKIPVGEVAAVTAKLEDLAKDIHFDPAQKTTLKLELTPNDPRKDNAWKTIEYGPTPGPDDNQPEDDKGEGAKEELFFRRFLRVKNETPDSVSVFLQYSTNEGGSWKWVPAAPETGSSLSFELTSGEERLLSNQDHKITAGSVRVFARSEDRKWERYRDQDLWLVPEKENDTHQYKAGSVETFTYRIALPPGSLAAVSPSEPEDQQDGSKVLSVTEFGVSTFASPLTGNTSPSSPPDPTAVDPDQPVSSSTPVVPIPPIQPVIPIPLDPNQPVPPLPPGIQPPISQALDADLAVVRFKMDAFGRFDLKIRNLGSGDYFGGRQWYLLDQNGLVPIRQGAIASLGMNDQQSFSGIIPAVTPGMAYYVELSPGDNNPNNDNKGCIFKPGPNSDLAVGNVSTVLNGATVNLQATITNKGPRPYFGGSRTYTMGDLGGLVTSPPMPVPDLKVGQTTTIRLDVTSIAGGISNLFVSLGGNDSDFTNDSGTCLHLPSGLNNAADLAISNLAIVGNNLAVTVKNNGPQAYDFRAGRAISVNNNNNLQPITLSANMAPGSSSDYMFLLGSQPPATPTTYQVSLSAGDANQVNDSFIWAYNPQTPAAPATTLKLTKLAVSGTDLTATIFNQGSGALVPPRTIVFSVMNAQGSQQLQHQVSMPIQANSFGTETVSLSAVVRNLPPGPVVLRADLNAINNTNPDSFALCAYQVPGPPSTPKSVDIAVSPLLIVGDKLTASFRNVGSENGTGPRTCRFICSNLSNTNPFVFTKDVSIPPINAGAAVPVNFSQMGILPGSLQAWLASKGVSPGETVTFTIQIDPAGFPPPATESDPITSNNLQVLSYTVGASNTNYKLEVQNLEFDKSTRALRFSFKNTGVGPGSNYPGGVLQFKIEATGDKTGTVVGTTVINPLNAGFTSPVQQQVVSSGMFPTGSGEEVSYTVSIVETPTGTIRDQKSVEYKVPGGLDLGVQVRAPLPDRLRFEISNNSLPLTPYPGDRSYDLYVVTIMDGKEHLVLPNLPIPGFAGPGRLIQTPFQGPVSGWIASSVNPKLPPGTTGEVKIRLRLQDSDSNPTNDMADDPNLYKLPNPPPSGTFTDLAVTDVFLDSPKGPTDTIKVKVKNLGQFNYQRSEGRTVTLAENGNEINAGITIPVDMLPGETKDFSLMTGDFKRGTFTGKISGIPASGVTNGNPATDPNPGNDTLSKELKGTAPSGAYDDIQIVHVEWYKDALTGTHDVRVRLKNFATTQQPSANLSLVYPGIPPKIVPTNSVVAGTEIWTTITGVSTSPAGIDIELQDSSNQLMKFKLPMTAK